MYAYRTTSSGVRYPLTKIRVDEMDALLKDPLKGPVSSLPMYYDLNGRVWPIPLKGWKVAFDEQA